MSRSTSATRFFRYAAACVLASLLPVTQASAGGSSRQLYNKSITIFWGETTSNKRVSDGKMVASDGKLTRVIYVSSAGRVFIRVAGGNSGGSNHSFEVSPDAAKGRTDFHGSELTYYSVNQAVVRRISVAFDAAFSGCSASITAGKNGSSPKWIGFDDAEYYLLAINVGAVSCSIREGNAFAG
jgi:hypothetical protein